VRALPACLVTLLAMASAHAVRADVIDEEARQLATASAYKRRLAAVLILAKHDDGRAVRALAEACAAIARCRSGGSPPSASARRSPRPRR
jgi:regulator of PEP synthase PpsR (kinase-PPPase family)